MNARAEALAVQMLEQGWIDRYDRFRVAQLIEDVIERDRASRDDTTEEETLP